jgi:hypothetical protein
MPLYFFLSAAFGFFLFFLSFFWLLSPFPMVSSFEVNARLPDCAGDYPAMRKTASSNAATKSRPMWSPIRLVRMFSSDCEFSLLPAMRILLREKLGCGEKVSEGRMRGRATDRHDQFASSGRHSALSHRASVLEKSRP